MDRLISENAVKTLLTDKMDALANLLKNPMCKGANRKVVAAQMGVLLAVEQQLKFITAPADIATERDTVGGEFPCIAETLAHETAH